MSSPRDDNAPPAGEPTDLHTYDAEAHLPTSHSPLPAISVHGEPPEITMDAYMRVSQSPEFAELKGRFRGFAFPMSAAFLTWYFAYVLASVFAKDFMAIPVIGNLNLGMAIGLGQFVTTFLITWLYIRHMNKVIDPITKNLRTKLEGGEG